MPRPVLVTPPACEPLDLALTKQHCKVEVDDDDVLIERCIAAVRAEIERQTGLSMITATWDEAFERFPVMTMANPGAWLELARWPLQSIGSLSYVDSAGATQVLGAGNYVVNALTRPPRVIPATSWPAERSLAGAANVTVRYTTGFGANEEAVEALAPDLLQAMRVAVAELVMRREQRITGTIVAELDAVKRAVAGFRLRPMGLC